MSTTVDRFGTVDVLANVAGAIFLGLIADTPLQEYLRVNRVNEVGTFLGIRSVIPTMTAAGRGSIINYSSVEAFHVVPFTAATRRASSPSAGSRRPPRWSSPGTASG